MLWKRWWLHSFLQMLIIFSVGVSWLSLVGSGKADPPVGPGMNYLVGAYQGPVAIGDFNNDGRPDLVAAGDGFTVLMNKGNGLFASPVTYPVAGGASGVVVGDFNNDGYPDLATTNGAFVQVALNQRDGTFPSGTTSYLGGNDPSTIAVGDFNKDGYPDLVVTSSGNSLYFTVSILLNKGDGTFAPPVSYPLGRGWHAVTIGDFNNDGYPDLAVVNSGDNSVSGASTVTVLLNKGDHSGTFASEATYSVGMYSYAIAEGDFHADGYPDLVVASSGNHDVELLLNKGDGTFVLGKTYSFDSQWALTDVKVGDFNGDDLPDFVVASQASHVEIFLNHKNGTFTNGPLYTFPETGSLLAVSDLNDDGQPDLVVAGANLTVLLTPYPDLTISNTNQGGSQCRVGQRIQYALTVSNGVKAGSLEKAQTVVVTDTITAGLQHIVVQGQNWQFRLSGTGTTSTSPLVLTATYVGAYPIPPGKILPPITISGSVTHDAIPILKANAVVHTRNDSNRRNNAPIDTISVTAA